jgi:outer membrane protein assembly factor BamA
MMRKDPLLLSRSLLCALVVFLTGLSGSAGAQSYFAFPLPYGKIVREIRIRGLVQTPESTVIRLLESKVGEPYTEETEDHDRRYLDRLGLFAAVQADPVVVGDEVFLTLSIRELPNFVPFPKLTISDTNGTSGGMGVRMANLLGRTLSLSGSFRLGGATHADVSLETPWRPPGEQSYGVHYDYRDRRDKHDIHRENSHELELRLGVNLHSDWMLSARGGYLSFGSDTPGITLSPTNRDHTPHLGAVLEYDHLDSASVPRNGWRGIFDVTQNGGFLGGDGDFVTAQFDLRRYQSLAHRHGLVLFTFASLQSGRVGGDLPVYRDFHIGGTNTVRGWESGARQGKNQFINTVEYRYDLLHPRLFRVRKYSLYYGLQLAAFADLGTAWNEGGDFTRNVIAGGGVGIRFLVPFLDVIRLDFGFGQAGAGIQPHLHIHEKAHYTRKRIR